MGMKQAYIKYEALSSEIKHEINDYHRSIAAGASEPMLDETVIEWFEKKFDEWLIRKYSDKKEASRRKHFRLDVEIPIRIIDTLIESSSEDHHALEFVGKIVNISRGGLYFKYTRPIELSSIIKVVIDFANIDAVLNGVEALAMVIRADRLQEDDYGIGIMFSSFYGSEKDKLDLFILKNLSYYIYPE
jgi:hypothetical protein